MHIRYLLPLCLLACAVTACGDEKKPPATANAVDEPPDHRASNPKPSDDPAQSNVRVSEDVRTACGLSDDEAYFAFNSAAVRGKDRATLKKLADCFETGPLKGKTMRLVGHCDPRGTEDYNMALGGRRADNVERVIVAQGLSNNKVTTTSRGALDATGTDETSWAKDRNVDVTASE